MKELLSKLSGEDTAILVFFTLAAAVIIVGIICYTILVALGKG